jgi:hypothetical protein
MCAPMHGHAGCACMLHNTQVGKRAAPQNILSSIVGGWITACYARLECAYNMACGAPAAAATAAYLGTCSSSFCYQCEPLATQLACREVLTALLLMHVTCCLSIACREVLVAMPFNAWSRTRRGSQGMAHTCDALLLCLQAACSQLAAWR